MSNNASYTDFKRLSESRQDTIRSFSFIISVCGAAFLSIGFIFPRFSTSQSLNLQIEQSINPNEASIYSLIRLPGIGTERACAIVEYRENLKRSNNSLVVFQNCYDLQKVKGIGPKTVQKVEKWLKFE